MVLVFEHEGGIFDVIYFYFINLATNGRVKIHVRNVYSEQILLCFVGIKY